MIYSGQIVLFCSREIQDVPDTDLITKDDQINEQVGIELHSGRKRYGGGFKWIKDNDIVLLKAYWRTDVVPLDVRLHLFGTTSDNTIGCLVLECLAPELINHIFKNSLCRKLITFRCENVIEYNPNVDVKAFKPKDELVIGVDVHL